MTVRSSQAQWVPVVPDSEAAKIFDEQIRTQAVKRKRNPKRRAVAQGRQYERALKRVRDRHVTEIQPEHGA
ncbi:MAG: hypothetical protein AAF721_34275, partial [Myxococcota bacterium]